MASEKLTNEKLDPGRVLSMTMHAGQILLQNGAEISRVEDTMIRLGKAFEVEHCDFFVLSNGIFVTCAEPGEGRWQNYSKVKHIPVKNTRLDRVVAINQLSRDVSSGKYTLAEVEEKLNEIEHMPEKPAWLQILASGLGAASFCVLFGGSLWDGCASFIVGVLLWIFVLKISNPYLGKIMGNILGGALVTICCMLLKYVGVGNELNNIIIGGIIPLVPGVAFTNGIRDIADGDYISGSVRLLDACLVFICIAVGVGVVYLLFDNFMGGVVL